MPTQESDTQQSPSAQPKENSPAPSTSEEAPPKDSAVAKNRGGKGRRKIEIKYIEDKTRRQITFSKRKAGLMKKAYELSTLTGTQILVLVTSETGHVYTFATKKFQPFITDPKGKNLIQQCLSASEIENSEPTDQDEDEQDEEPKQKHDNQEYTPPDQGQYYQQPKKEESSPHPSMPHPHMMQRGGEGQHMGGFNPNDYQRFGGVAPMMPRGGVPPQFMPQFQQQQQQKPQGENADSRASPHMMPHFQNSAMFSPSLSQMHQQDGRQQMPQFYQQMHAMQHNPHMSHQGANMSQPQGDNRDAQHYGSYNQSHSPKG